MNDDTASEESRARYAAKRIGLKAKKSRWRANTIDNFGGFMIIDPDRNAIVHGTRFELSAQDVIDYCERIDEVEIGSEKCHLNRETMTSNRGFSGTKEVPRINLEARISVDALKTLAGIFKGGVFRLTNAEISKTSGISERTVRNLKYVQARRPDLLKQVFKDEISLARAAVLTRADPEQWKTVRRTRF